MMPLWLVFAAVVAQESPNVRDQVLKLEDGSELRYAVSSPQGHDDGQPRPLVLALHYGWAGELPPGYGRSYMSLLVAPALAELGAVIITPDPPPWAMATTRAATSAAAPPEDPPVECAGFQGFRVGPWASGSVPALRPNSGVALRPRLTSPVAWNSRTKRSVRPAT